MTEQASDLSENSREQVSRKPFLKCRLCWLVTLAVFVSILIIEAIILVPSYYRFEDTWLQTLEKQALSGYHSLRQSVPVDQALNHSQLASLLQPDTGIVALAEYRQGRQSFQAGENHAEHWSATWSEKGVSRLLSRERYQVFWQEGDFRLGMILDSSELQPELNAYVMRIVGLVLIIAGFVTLATSLTLRFLLFGPILLLRARLEAESRDPMHPKRYIIDKVPNHELGDIITRFNKLQEVLHENIIKINEQQQNLKDTNRKLRVENCERTAAMYEAERANRLKSEFLANMSHELRTPMHAILSFSELGSMEVADGDRESLEEYFTLINSSGQQLLGLLNDLLDLAKLEAGKVEYNMEPEDLGDLTADVLHQLQPLLSDKKQQADIQREDRKQPVSCDKVRIRQVITNLLSNAIKFSPEGSTITVEIEREEDAGKSGIAVRLKDQGVGIPEGELEAIFDKFTQSSKNATGTGGTGLGLAITREIINDHGGWIIAANRKKGGACFHIWLPLDQSDSYRSKVLD